MATVTNICPARISYELDIPGIGTYGPVGPGESIEVPDEAVPLLPETIWKGGGANKARDAAEKAEREKASRAKATDDKRAKAQEEKI